MIHSWFWFQNYRRNQKAFEHDLVRFQSRNGCKPFHPPRWQGDVISVFQLFQAVVERGGFYQVLERASMGTGFRHGFIGTGLRHRFMGTGFRHGSMGTGFRHGFRGRGLGASI